MNIKNILWKLSLVCLVSTSVYAGDKSVVAECTVDGVTEPRQESSNLYQLDGKAFAEANLPMSLQQALFDARLKHYKEQLSIIDQALLMNEIERQAKKNGKSFDAIARELFEEKTPTSQAVKEFYEVNKDRITEPLESIEKQIIEALIQRDIVDRQVKMLEKLKEENGFELSIPKPAAPHAEIAIQGFPRKGAENAKVTIVEFADYQCPHCKKAAAVLNQIVKKYPDDVAVIYLDFPINRSGISRKVAVGGTCASQQNKFWEYHDLAYDEQESLNNDAALTLAGKVGLDLESFKVCIQSSGAAKRVSMGEEEALRLGLTGTPALFLNGRRLHLHDIETDLEKEIEDVLSDNDGNS